MHPPPPAHASEPPVSTATREVARRSRASGVRTLPRPPRVPRRAEPYAKASWLAPALGSASAALSAAAAVGGYLGWLPMSPEVVSLLAASTLLQLGARAALRPGSRGQRTGERVGRYELRECLGCGGMGEVWRAHDRGRRRDVALKLLRAYRSSPVAVRRFEREICVTRNLTHPNTVELYDFGVTKQGDHFYAMQLLEGESLAALLGRAGPLPWQRAAAFARSVADTLAEAHAQGVVHRDLKPENLFVTHDDGPRGHLKLLDFGVAAVPGEQSGEPLTRASCVAGTPSYVAPEVAAGGVSVAASDIYALGVVMYRMLTGHLPFALKSDTAVSQFFVHATLPGVPPSQHVSLPASLEALVMRCLEKDPAARYPDARALADALDALSLPLDGYLDAEPGALQRTREPVTSPATRWRPAEAARDEC